MPPLLDRLELVPTTESQGTCTQWTDSNTFSLSAPVLDASVQDFLRDDFHQNAREVLQFWIGMDMANLDRVKAGIHSFQMPYQYNANGPAYGGWVMQGITKAESLESAMSRVKELVAYLTSQFHRRGDLAGAARCPILLRHLFKEDTSGATHDPSLHGAINELVNGLKSYLFRGVDALNAMIDQRLTSGSHEGPPSSVTGRRDR
jgi:hypothetical protein